MAILPTETLHTTTFLFVFYDRFHILTCLYLQQIQCVLVIWWTSYLLSIDLFFTQAPLALERYWVKCWACHCY